jgi:hypothetical protein
MTINYNRLMGFFIMCYSLFVFYILCDFGTKSSLPTLLEIAIWSSIFTFFVFFLLGAVYMFTDLGE